MNWKVKGLGQSVLSTFPGGAKLNYWGQKFIIRAHSDLGQVVENRLENARWFTQQFTDQSGEELGRARFYEFGAGWNLAGPLALYSLGVNRQVVVDRTHSARLEMANQVVAEIDQYAGRLPRRPGKPLRSLRELETRLGIDYRAPADACHTGLPPDSVDCITSTFMLEHIPAADLRALLAECRRILKPGGVLLSMIDYQDHYSYRDPRISVYNFLQYSERKWKWFNSPLHYQNRLRHCEYRQLFGDAGFEILAEELKEPSSEERECLRSLRLSADFRDFSFDDLMVLGSQMVCRRPGRSSRLSTVKDRATAGYTGCAGGVTADGAVAH
jgi:SAM-dependent methyltransferase